MNEQKQYENLQGASFFESFLMNVEVLSWPNIASFGVWSPKDDTFYKITAEPVLEFHYIRVGTGQLEGGDDGIPLSNIVVSHDDEYQYWSARVKAFAEQGYDRGGDPICLEFHSNLFANRRRQLLTRNRNMGILVACRKVRVVPDPTYQGHRPNPHRIPAK